MNKHEADKSLTFILSDLTNKMIDPDKNQPDILYYLGIFRDRIYVENYRHKYSDVSNVIFRLSEEQYECIAANMRVICEQAVAICEYNDISQSLDKLRDHIDLEIARLSMFARSADKSSSTLTDLTQRADDLKRTTEETTQRMGSLDSKMSSLDTKLNSSTTETITILSIFAGVVFVFSGGIALLGNAIQGAVTATKDNIYYLVIVTLIVGLILLNLLFLLFYMILKINGKMLHLGCSKECHECGECNTHWGKLKKKYPLIMWLNAIFTIGIVISIVLCFLRNASFMSVFRY